MLSLRKVIEMAVEYIRLTPEELRYGKKGLLEAQLYLLNAAKHEAQYKKLRKEEFLLKIALRKSAEDALSSLNLFQSFLPKTVVKEEKHHVPVVQKTAAVADARAFSLDQEIECIKQKLVALR